MRIRSIRGCLQSSRFVWGVVAWALVSVSQVVFVAPALAAEHSDRATESRLIERWRAASPSERRALRAELRKRFDDATPRERRRVTRRLRALERALPDFSSIERLILLRAAAALPEAARKDLRKRLRRIDDLEPASRALLVAELKAMIRSFDGEIDRLERNRERWQGMSESERDEYRAQMKRLRGMSLEERRALLEEMERAREAP